MDYSKLKLSKHDKQFVMSVNLADMFLRDAIIKITKCIELKKDKLSAELLNSVKEELSKINKSLYDINCDLTDTFSDNDIELFTKISDRIIEKIIMNVSGEKYNGTGKS